MDDTVDRERSDSSESPPEAVKASAPFVFTAPNGAGNGSAGNGSAGNGSADGATKQREEAAAAAKAEERQAAERRAEVPAAQKPEHKVPVANGKLPSSKVPQSEPIAPLGKPEVVKKEKPAAVQKEKAAAAQPKPAAVQPKPAVAKPAPKPAPGIFGMPTLSPVAAPAARGPVSIEKSAKAIAGLEFVGAMGLGEDVVFGTKVRKGAGGERERAWRWMVVWTPCLSVGVQGQGPCV